MRSTRHLIDHLVCCHPEELLVVLEIAGSADETLLNAVSDTMSTMMANDITKTITTVGDYAKIRVKRTYDFKETETLRLFIVNSIY